MNKPVPSLDTALALMLLVLGVSGAAAALAFWFLLFFAIGKFGLLPALRLIGALL